MKASFNRSSKSGNLLADLIQASDLISLSFITHFPNINSMIFEPFATLYLVFPALTRLMAASLYSRGYEMLTPTNRC